MATPRLAESGSRRVGELATNRFFVKHSKAESVSRRLPESESQRLAELESRLPDTPIRRVADSAESGSRFSITNISANSKPKSERLER